MADDDDFGDLYTDVLGHLEKQFQQQHEETGAPTAAAKAAASQGRQIDLNINSDDEEILYGAPDLKSSNSNSNLNLNPSSALGWNLNAPIQEKTLPEPRGFDLNLDSNLEAARIDGLVGNGGDGSGFEARVLEKGEGVELRRKASGVSSFMEDDDVDINIILEERENKDEDLVEKDDNFINKEDKIYISAAQKENTMSFVNDTVVDEMGSEQIIPGLSGRLENPRASNIEDEWESEESEDDLQIVLNDNNHGPMGMERMPGVIDDDDDEDEDGEPLVIVAGNGDVGHHHHQAQRMMDEQEWGGEEGGTGAEGEKDLGDAAKASGGGGGTAPAPVQPKIAYSNHVYHHPFPSQFKVSILFDEHFECELDSSCNCGAFVVKLYILVILKMISNVVDELLSHGDGILNCTDFNLSLIMKLHIFFMDFSLYLRLLMLVSNEVGILNPAVI